jgi:hypothetical protein
MSQMVFTDANAEDFEVGLYEFQKGEGFHKAAVSAQKAISVLWG